MLSPSSSPFTTDLLLVFSYFPFYLPSTSLIQTAAELLSLLPRLAFLTFPTVLFTFQFITSIFCCFQTAVEHFEGSVLDVELVLRGGEAHRHTTPLAHVRHTEGMAPGRWPLNGDSANQCRAFTYGDHTLEKKQNKKNKQTGNGSRFREVKITHVEDLVTYSHQSPLNLFPDA